MSKHGNARRKWRSWEGLALGLALTVACAPATVFAQASEENATDESAVPARPLPAGPLPWEQRPRVGEPVLRPPSGAKEILERYDIGESQLQNFFSGQPLSPSEEDVLVKILYHFPRLGLDNLAEWRRKDVSLDQAAAAPADFRTEILALRGRVKLVEKVTLIPELAELYEFAGYYRVTLDIDDSPYQALICARKVPIAWKIGEPMDERAAVDGMFLKLGDSTAAEPNLIFAAGRVAWLPDRPEPVNHVGQPQIELANMGVDYGLFDDVREGNGKTILDVDREAFYQVLHALGQPGAAKLKGAGPEPIDVVPLLEKPAAHHGQILPVRGTARRILKVPVRDKDIQRRFGIDHYYEIDLFLPLGDTTLKFGKDKTDPVYSNGFPATLIVRKLPPGLSEGERVVQGVRADAVFFKIWSYRSVYAEKFGKVQPAPLFLAAEPQIVVAEQQSHVVVNVLVGTAFGLAIGVIGIVLWWFRRSDRAYEAVRRETDAAKSAPPDFSSLAK